MKILSSKKRKFLLGATSAIVALLSATACTEDHEGEMAYADAYATTSELLKQLTAFNETLDAGLPNSRGDNGCTQITDIIVADAQGAYKGSKAIGKIASKFGQNGQKVGKEAGGVVIGSASSYKRYLEIEQAKFSTPMGADTRITTDQETFTAGYASTKDAVQKKDYSLGIAWGLDSCSIKVGILHNKVLDEIKLIEKSGNQKDLLSRLNPGEKNLIESDDFKVAYNNIISNSTEISFSQTLSDQVMNMFVEAVEKSGEDQNSVCRIISKYTIEVSLSKDLSEEDKESLYIGFAVMGYSHAYWSERLPDLDGKQIP